MARVKRKVEIPEVDVVAHIREKLVPGWRFAREEGYAAPSDDPPWTVYVFQLPEGVREHYGFPEAGNDLVRVLEDGTLSYRRSMMIDNPSSG